MNVKKRNDMKSGLNLLVQIYSRSLLSRMLSSDGLRYSLSIKQLDYELEISITDRNRA